MCNCIALYLYLYSAQNLHVLQDSKRYMTHLTVQAQFNSQFTCIPLTERQRLKDDHLSTSLRLFNLPLGVGPNDRGPPFEVVIMYLPVHGTEPTSSVFLVVFSKYPFWWDRVGIDFSGRVPGYPVNQEKISVHSKHGCFHKSGVT